MRCPRRSPRSFLPRAGSAHFALLREKVTSILDTRSHVAYYQQEMSFGAGAEAPSSFEPGDHDQSNRAGQTRPVNNPN